MLLRESGVVNLKSSLTGALLGTAVGDALGLAREGLSSRRAARLFGEPGQYQVLPRWGVISDDTEHACLTAQSLLATGNDAEAFARELARQMRRWAIVCPAGAGRATLLASCRLWLGVSPHWRGVFSAGNGPAMRSGILGIAVEDLDQLRTLVRISTRLTHTDPKAECGALAIAAAARLSSRTKTTITGDEYQKLLREIVTSDTVVNNATDELLAVVDRIVVSVERHEATESFAASLGCAGFVSGYVYHTVPIVLHAWLRHPQEYRDAVLSVIRCGGDTDTTAALVGGIVGGAVGPEGIPDEWLRDLCDWPWTRQRMEQLAAQLAEARQQAGVMTPPEFALPGALVRNLAFLAIVLAHGVRRLFPPY